MRKGARIVCLVLSAALAGCAANAPVESSAPAASVTVSAACTPEPSATPALADVTLYLPDTDGAGLVAAPAQAEDSPGGLLSALAAAGALPDADYQGSITFGVGEETVATSDGVFSGVIVRLDLPDAFAQAVRQSDAENETLILQSLVDTFLTRYAADAMILTIEGTVLETVHGMYEDPMTFDEFVEIANGS